MIERTEQKTTNDTVNDDNDDDDDDDCIKSEMERMRKRRISVVIQKMVRTLNIMQH